MQPIEIEPRGPFEARVRIPGSKSLSARALIAAALADGRSELPGLLYCDDTRYLANALTDLGIAVSMDTDGNTCTVMGTGGEIPVRRGLLFLGNAGTAMRFLAGMLTVGGGQYELDGTERMRRRPIGQLVKALGELGAEIRSTDGYPPVSIGPQRLRGGAVAIPGSPSSQFITSLLMVGPVTNEGVEVQVTGDVVSRPYLDLTCAAMEAFGCPVHVTADPLTFSVRPGWYSARSWPIEADASSASYFFAAAAITGGEVTVDGLGTSSRQGDLAFLDVLASMGCTVTRGTNQITVRGGPLTGVSVDAADFPDMVPTIAAVAIFARGTSEISGVPHLRIKESDRIRSLTTELGKLGAAVEEREDGLVVAGGRELHGRPIDPWDDHRIAMAAAVVGLRVPGVVIENPGVVAKSFPEFFDRLGELGRGEE